MSALVDQVKAIQKQEGGADSWAEFVAQNGGGKRDPAMKPPHMLQAFIQQSMAMGYSAQAKGGGGGGGGGGKKGGKGKGGGGAWGAPKMPAGMGGFANLMMGGGGNDANLQNHMTLVTRVKASQKMEGGREAWIQFIDYKGGANRDPSRRTQEELEEFLGTYDPNGESLAPALEMATAQMMPMMQMMMGGGGMGMMNMMAGMGGGKGGGGKGGKSQFAPESEEHASLIQRVKTICKTEEVGKEAWGVFVSSSGLGKRDPAAHSCESLAAFISQHDPTFDPTTLSLSTESNKSLVEQIRKGQKMSDEFRDAWIAYTDANGNGVRDGARHDAAFIQQFLDTAPMYESFESDAEHAALVAKIKNGQKSSQEFKEQWWTFCESYGAGKNDPLKHDKAFLQNFVAQTAVPTGGGGIVSKGWGGKSKSQGKGKGARWTPY